jgi:hypothetical protein
LPCRSIRYLSKRMMRATIMLPWDVHAARLCRLSARIGSGSRAALRRPLSTVDEHNKGRRLPHGRPRASKEKLSGGNVSLTLCP